MVSNECLDVKRRNAWRELTGAYAYARTGTRTTIFSSTFDFFG